MESNSTNPQYTAQPSATETLKEPVKQILNQGQEAASQVAGQVKHGIVSSIDGQKQRAAESLDLVCQGLHEMGTRIASQGSPQIGSYLHHAHHSLERYSNYLRENELNDIVEDVQVFARQNPTMMVGSLFALGFLAGRFLRSSAPQTKSLAVYRGDTYRGDTYRGDAYTGDAYEHQIRQRPSVTTTVPPVKFQEDPTWR